MFNSVAIYAPINATVRALYSETLSSATKHALIQAPDFSALINVLSKTIYGPYLDRVQHAALTPRRVVYQLRCHLADVYAKLIRLTPEPGKQLLTQLWYLYEVDNLKATLRGVETGASWDQVRHLLSPTLKYNILTTEDMERMLRSSDIQHAIERIAHTAYYDILIHAVERYAAEQNLFPLEVALDIEHRRNLWHSITQLKGEDFRQAQHLVGTILDMDNLLWAIRYRVYHHLSEQEIVNYTLPQGYRVKDADIRAIAEGENIAHVVQRIYPDVPELATLETESKGVPRPPSQWLVHLERTLNTRVVHLCRRTFIGNPFHIGIPIAYLLLNEYEIKDLTAIIEAHTRNLDVEMLRSVIEI